MPRHRFTLAALATLAVPGLDVAVTRTFTGGGDGQYDAALITDALGSHFIVRAPVDRSSAERLEAEERALGALTSGARARLPFDAPTVVGVLPKPRTVVGGYIEGVRLQPPVVRPDGPLAGSVGRALAAVHDLPAAVVADAGLPVASAADCARAVDELVRRADSCGDVPLELVGRWSAAAADPALWRFRPTVVHGAMGAECVLVDREGERVTGLLGWGLLAVGDPARDLAWALGLPEPGAPAAVLGAYAAARPQEHDPALAQRALLYAELELVRWLLHGLERRDPVVVEDAVQMLEALLASVLEHTAGSLGHDRMPPLTVAEVERMLAARHAAPLAAQASSSSSSE
ncbi:phosphotransferase [Amnibacterium endophyticum]|uniref:Phosphotransferase n=1 Tax=Amnibacterium endophyticum TaxID=2109337 RepID=A0ABW4LE22_9MICO